MQQNWTEVLDRAGKAGLLEKGEAMHELTVEVGYREEEAEIWPDATPEERLNTTAVMLVLDNAGDFPAVNLFYNIHFSCDYATSRITYRTSEMPERLTVLRHAFDTIPEIRVVSASI
jgi:hypothetical protein